MTDDSNDDQNDPFYTGSFEYQPPKRRLAAKRPPASSGEEEAQIEGREKRVDVGYRKPPRERQFQPGVSGNPRGRRPTPPPVGLGHALVEGGRKIETVRRGGRNVKMPRYAILSESLWAKAINGNVREKATFVALLVRTGAYRVEEELERIREADEERRDGEGYNEELERQLRIIERDFTDFED